MSTTLPELKTCARCKQTTGFFDLVDPRMVCISCHGPRCTTGIDCGLSSVDREGLADEQAKDRLIQEATKLWNDLSEVDDLRARIAAKGEQIAKLSESLHHAVHLARSAHEVAELAWGGEIPSPLPGHRHQTEEEFAAEMERLNCPLCDGSGHVDDADQAVVEKIKSLEVKVQRLEAVRVAAEAVHNHINQGLLPDWYRDIFDLHDTLQAASSDEQASSYGVAVNGTAT